MASMQYRYSQQKNIYGYPAWPVQNKHMGLIEFSSPSGVGAAVGAIGAAIGGMAGLSVSTFGAAMESVGVGFLGGESLTLAIDGFNVKSRKVAMGDIHYLNGVVHYPTKPTGLEAFTVNFRDYIDGTARSALEKWFELVIYDDRIGAPQALTLKTSASVVLLDVQGTVRRSWTIEGVLPMGKPDIEIDHKSGEQVMMAVSFSADYLISQPISPVGAIISGVAALAQAGV